ncbi:Gfo/Idh/MocA family protein [Sinomonas sp. P10A9]|uniref:Gfo/Idh/MocA family protein n=1 Tax=Sinomonas puerhi TaxID=3238584 RepID=A0AB39L3Q6_9MICC
MPNSVPPSRPSASSPEPGPLRAAVVGCGDISAQHFAAIGGLAAQGTARLAAVVDLDPQRRGAAAGAHGVPGYETLGEALAGGGIDVVHLCTPHSEHVPLALEALAAGVHVLTEKPVAHTLGDAERLIAAARTAFSEGGTQLGVCFQNRYNAPVVAMRSLLEGGTLGAVTGAEATVMWHRPAAYYEAKPWRSTWAGSGGGLLMNQAIHTLDLLQWLVGPATVVGGGASTRTLADTIEVEDTADIFLDHARGSDGSPVRSAFFATNANGRNAPVTLHIETEAAELRLRGALSVQYADGRLDTVEEAGALPGERSYWGASHWLLVADFYRAVRSGERFWIGAEEASESLRLIKDVYSRSYPAGEWV